MLALYKTHKAETINCVCNQVGVRAVFRAHQTLRQTFVKVKTPTPERKRKDVIYEVSCNDSDGVYIGETNNYVQERQTEHKLQYNSKITIMEWKYMWDKSHNVNWEKARVIQSEPL